MGTLVGSIEGTPIGIKAGIPEGTPVGDVVGESVCGIQHLKDRRTYIVFVPPHLQVRLGHRSARVQGPSVSESAGACRCVPEHRPLSILHAPARIRNLSYLVYAQQLVHFPTRSECGDLTKNNKARPQPKIKMVGCARKGKVVHHRTG